MTTPQPYNWIRKIPGDLFNLDEKPLLGFPPSFDWDKFSAELNRALQTSDISIKPGDLQWLSKEDLFAGLGDKLRGLSLTINPVPGPVWWVMPEFAVAHFMELLLVKQPETASEITIDEDFLKASCQFLAIEAITAFEKTDFDKKLEPLVLRSADLPAEPCLCLDVSISFKQETFYGRLCLSTAFRKAWMQRYLLQKATLALSSPIADALDVIIHLEAGRIDMKPSEWQQIAIGDYVLIDSCSIDPDEDKGRVMLVINGTPCFRGKLKQGSLKILEHPLYHEVDKTMATPPKNSEHEENDHEEEEFDDAEFEDGEAEGEEEEPEIEDEDFDIEDEEIEEDSEQDIEKTAPSASKTSSPPAAKASSAPAGGALKATPSNTPLSVDELPLQIVIEVGRIQMSVKKLLELQPGNMLELDLHPDAGIDMVINGKRIARGELLRIGDALGLRITELS